MPSILGKRLTHIMGDEVKSYRISADALSYTLIREEKTKNISNDVTNTFLQRIKKQLSFEMRNILCVELSDIQVTVMPEVF